MRRHEVRRLIAISTIAVLGIATSRVHARNDVLFQTGDNATTGYTFQSSFAPVINDNGLVAFSAQLTNSAATNAPAYGVFVLNTASSSLAAIALTGISVYGNSDPNTILTSVEQVLLNDDGNIAFAGNVGSNGSQLGDFTWTPPSQTWNHVGTIQAAAVPGEQFWMWQDQTTGTTPPGAT
jgi:hypothetical protein